MIILIYITKKIVKILYLDRKGNARVCHNSARLYEKILTRLIFLQGLTKKHKPNSSVDNPATVSKWCTNAAQPTLETMMQIAKLLNVEMNDLVRFEALPDIPSPEEDVTSKRTRHN